MFGSLKHYLGPRICSIVPLNLWHWLTDVEILLPYYHMIVDYNLAHVNEFRNIKQFKADIEFFLRFYKPVSLQDVIKHLEGTERLPKRCFLLTFDDGFREIYDIVAPILYAQGVPAIFFVSTSFVDNNNLGYPQKISLLIHAVKSLKNSSVKRKISLILANAGIKRADLFLGIRSITYRQRHLLEEIGHVMACDFATYVATVEPYLTSTQISDLIKKGFEIGAHSVDHPPYADLSLDEQLMQTRESVSWLSSRFQYECCSFAFPFNDAGVSVEFFHTVFADERLKVSFGTNGMHRHFFPRNLSRYTMEHCSLKAVQITAREFAVTHLRRSLHACL